MSMPTEREGPVGAKAGQTPERPARRRRQYKLNHLMMLSVVCALEFYFLGNAIRRGSTEDISLAVLAVGLAVFALGITSLVRMVRSAWMGWLLVILGAIGLVVGALMMVGATVGSLSVIVFGFFLFFLFWLLLSIAHLLARYRTLQQDALLWALTLATDRSMPIGPSIRAFSEQLGPSFRGKARGLADCVDNGMPLPDAFEFVEKSASPPAMVLARVGWDAGALPEALKAATSDRLNRGASSREFGPKVVYLSMLLISMQSVIGFVMYFIIPKFEAIFKDFGVPLPGATILVIEASYLFSTSGIGPLALTAEIAFLLYLPFALNGWGGVSIPLIDRFFIRRHRILILRSLAIVVAQRQPVALGVLSLSRSYPTPWIRRRLVGAWKGIESGVGWADALRAYGLLSRNDADVLVASERVGNLAWAIREVAETSNRRYAQRLDLLSQVIFVAILLFAGALVGLLAVAYFVPLVDLISRLAG